MITPAALGIGGQTQGQNQRAAVEQGLNEEGAAELLYARGSHGQENNRRHTAPDIHPPGLNRGRPQKSTHQGGKKEVLSHTRLSYPQLRRQNDSGEGGDNTRGGEGAHNVFLHVNPVEQGGSRIGPHRVHPPSHGEMGGDNPQNHRQNAGVEGNDGEHADIGKVEAFEAHGHLAQDNLPPAGMPQ